MTSGVSSSAGPYRVMVVDDSAVIRGLVARALEVDADIKVVASVADGQMAVNSLAKSDAEVVVLDIEMPVMNGLEALPKLLAINPHVKIIVSSTLTLENAEVSFRALELGAADYIPKPDTKKLHAAVDFKRELTSKVKVYGALARSLMSGGGSRGGSQPKQATAARPVPAARPEIIAIGSSTGGPQALFSVLASLKDVPVPIVITQHMPPRFTTILAQHITSQAGVPCTEARSGDKLEAGKAFLAPGDYHMTFEGVPGSVRVVLNQEAPENFCRPAVDPMLRSLAAIYGKRVVVAILTGMGNDGMKGAQSIADAGGTIVAQDEATSIVWGMPAAVAKAGLADAIMSLNTIGPWLREQVMQVH
ncbi:MAG: chemotaxis response regulator protein-glutamate methylesterase [Bdellovibrionales bacterium]